MTCAACGEPAVISKKYEDLCQFHWDCLKHELKIVLDSIRDYGQYSKYNRGPNFFAIFYGWMKGDKEHGPQYSGPGFSTLGYGLYLSDTPRRAMNEAMRVARRNDWRLLRVDNQRTLKDIYVSGDYQTYMPYSKIPPLPYDAAKFGELETL